jgi:hypothetical protein
VDHSGSPRAKLKIPGELRTADTAGNQGLLAAKESPLLDMRDDAEGAKRAGWRKHCWRRRTCERRYHHRRRNPTAARARADRVCSPPDLATSGARLSGQASIPNNWPLPSGRCHAPLAPTRPRFRRCLSEGRQCVNPRLKPSGGCSFSVNFSIAILWLPVFSSVAWMRVFHPMPERWRYCATAADQEVRCVRSPSISGR